MTDADTIPAVPLSSITSTKDRRKLGALCSEYREQSQVEADAKAVKKALKPQIAEIAKEHGLTKVAGPGWALSEVTSVRKSISAKRLAELGVSLKTIEAATVESASTYFQVRARGE